MTDIARVDRRNDVDNGTVWYARLAGLYQFGDVGKLNLTYQHQETFAGDYPYETPGLSYAQTRDLKEPLKNKTDLASLDVSVDAGFATVSSTSSFTNQIDHSVADLTGLIEELNPILYGNYPRVTSPIFDHDGIRTWTEELRLTSNDTGPLEWVAGAWYSYQFAENGSSETIPGYAAWTALPGTGSPPGCTVFDATQPSQADPTGTLTASSATTFHKNVFKANTSYELAPDTLLYYTWSQGFRRGGANGLPTGDCLFCVTASQLTYQPDIAINNEVGIKGRVAQLFT